jgi:F-type H+-transporting ATPase subunit b
MLLSIGFAEEGGGALTVHPYWIVVSIIQFLLLFFLLRRFLWGPILKTLHDRAERIREGLAMAEAAKEERERMKVEVERLLADARREAQLIGERMTKAAETAAADVRTQAKAEADRIRERGREDATQSHDQALAQLRSELAGMVILAASRVLGRELDADKHRALIEQSLDEAAPQLTEQR